MSRSRSGSFSAPGNHGRPRSNSQSYVESAISAIQQRGGDGTAEPSGAFSPGTGGFIGGPPISSSLGVADHGVVTTATGTSPGGARRASVRHRKDLSHYTLNGKRVRTTDRICSEVPAPVKHRPSEPQFWSYADVNNPRPSLPFLREHFQFEGRLTEEQAIYILNAATLLFEREPNLIKVGDGVTICGDVHGQYYDLLKLFEIGGDPSETPYLFLGDYVDRGAFGIECLLYLYALKLHYPTTFFLLRGNHECRHLTEFFTFKKECLHKYSSVVYEACIRSFCALPLAALLDERFLCVHGGIGPDMKTLADLNKINRFQEPGTEGTLCDILWADPIENYSRIPEAGEPPMARVRRQRKGKTKGKGPAKPNHDDSDDQGDAFLPPGFKPNHVRGCSYFYTYTAVCDFLGRNGLLSVIRGHEAQDAGYSMYRRTELNFPSLITIFSAPNYLDAYHNRAAVIKYIGQNITIRQFNSSPHPYSLPGFSDAFTWSLPFVGAKITEMLLAILNCCTREELEESTDEDSEDSVIPVDETEEERMQRREAIKNKVLAVGRMARVFDLLRDEAEGVSELTLESSPRDQAQRYNRDATLNTQGHRIRKSIHNFDEARKSDILNEHIPQARPISPWQPRGAEAQPPAGPYTNPSRPAPSAYPTTSSPSTNAANSPSSVGTWDYGSPSLVAGRRSTRDDTATMIRRTLAGGDYEKEQEILDLAQRLARPLVGKEVRHAYGGAGGTSKEARRIKRVDTA